MSKKVLIYCRQIQAVNNPIAVSYRNAAILANDLGADILMSKTDKLKQFDYDVIIFSYMNMYTDYKTLDGLLKKDQLRVLIRSEYEGVSMSRKTVKPYIDICNYDIQKHKTTQNPPIKSYQLNTNLLISRQPNPLTAKKYDCIYYSRHRADRMIYCREYLQGNIYLSTHPKNHKHFFHAGCRPKLIKHIDWTEGRETLNQFRYSLYIEDKYTHSVFNNLANRWYEAGFCNNVVFFDINCQNTIQKSEIAYHFDSYYYVSNHAELLQKIDECNKDWGKHLAIQKTWRLQEPLLRAKMIEELKQIIGI
jgi:hypothetical protein